MRVLLWVVGSVLLVVTGILGYARQKSPSPAQLIFVSKGQYEDKLYRMYSNGTGVHRLAEDTFSEEVRGIFTPASPDGKWLAVAKYAGKSFDIYTLDAQGYEVQLTTTSFAEISPAWSPDGNWIAYVANPDGNYDIYKMRVDGSEMQRLTDSPADEVAPAWLPIVDLDWRYELNVGLGLLLIMLGCLRVSMIKGAKRILRPIVAQSLIRTV